MTRVTDEPCVVLHTRPYRETSLILSAYSLHHGRVAMVARGVRGNRRGRVLQPLTVLRAGWFGRSSLLTLGTFEVDRQLWLQGDTLAAGLYIAELITRLVGERESHPRLFAAIVWSLENLQFELEPVLRSFEKILLEELGYGLDFQRDARSREPIEVGQLYRFEPTEGFVKSTAGPVYPGSGILAIARDDYSGVVERKIAKRIFRQALAVHLGPKPLGSRRLLSVRRR